MTPQSGYDKTALTAVLHVTMARKESAKRFQGLYDWPVAAPRHFRAIITELHIFQRAFAKKIPLAPPNFCPTGRAKLCKYTNFVGFAFFGTFFGAA